MDGRLADTRTLPERLAEIIREQVLRGTLQPGQPLRQAQLAARLGVSPIPLREALRLLEADGLVTMRPNRGAIVSPIDPAEIVDQTDVAIALQALALRLAFPRLTPAVLSRAEQFLEQIDREIDPARVTEHVQALYSTLYETAGRPKLMSHIQLTWAALKRYTRFWRIAAAETRSASRVHRDVLTALRRRNLNAAIRAMERSHRAAAAILAEHVARLPEEIRSPVRPRSRRVPRGVRGQPAQGPDALSGEAPKP